MIEEVYWYFCGVHFVTIVHQQPQSSFSIMCLHIFLSILFWPTSPYFSFWPRSPLAHSLMQPCNFNISLLLHFKNFPIGHWFLITHCKRLKLPSLGMYRALPDAPTHAYLYIHVYIFLFIYLFIHFFNCLFIYLFIYLYIYIYIEICMYIVTDRYMYLSIQAYNRYV